MNKIRLIVLGMTILLSPMLIATPKEDFDSAIKLVQEKKISEAVKLLETVSKSTDVEYVKKANYQLGMYNLTEGKNVEKAKKYFLEVSKDKKDVSEDALQSLYRLSEISFSQKDNKTAEQYLIELNTRTGNKNPKIYQEIGNFYMATTNLDKAEEAFKKSITLDDKSLASKALLLSVYEAKKDEASIAKTIADMKRTNANVNNMQIGAYFTQIGNYVLAEKYLIKAIKEDKDSKAKLSLGVLYYNYNFKDQGKALIAEAQKDGVKEAAGVLEQITKLEAQQTQQPKK